MSKESNERIERNGFEDDLIKADQRFRSIFDNITGEAERKRVEEELIASEHRFRAIFDNATDGILLTDVEQKRFFTANNRFCQMLGYTLDEIEYLGTSEIHPKDADPYVVDIFEKQAQGEFIQAEDIPVLRKDGGIFYADINTTPMEIAGKEYLVGIYRDITDRKMSEKELIASEHRFRAIFDNATDGILLTDVENKSFFTANNRFCQMLGYTLDEIEDLGVTDLHPEDLKAYIDDVFEKQGKGEFIYAGDIPVLRKNGSIFYADINTTPMEIAGKEYLVGIYRDVTERKELIKENLDAKDRIIEEMQRHKEYVDEVADRLRNPLQVQKALLEIIVEDELGSDNKEMFEKILKSNKDLEKWIMKLT